MYEFEARIRLSTEPLCVTSGAVDIDSGFSEQFGNSSDWHL
jgi:hypothetical protein